MFKSLVQRSVHFVGSYYVFISRCTVQQTELLIYLNCVKSPNGNILCWILPFAEFPVDYPCASLLEPNLSATMYYPPSLSVSTRSVGWYVCVCVCIYCFAGRVLL